MDGFPCEVVFMLRSQFLAVLGRAVNRLLADKHRRLPLGVSRPGQEYIRPNPWQEVDRFFAQLRAWSAAHPHAGPVVRNAQELRRLAAEESALALRDKPPAKG